MRAIQISHILHQEINFCEKQKIMEGKEEGKTALRRIS
jgi:hypothetical protein